MLFTFLAIVTGSLWGEPTWGTWWVWDARLTSMMFLMFFYISYILCFKFIKKEQLMLKVSSLIAILGAINLPIIKYSVDWWTTLHQPASIKLGVSLNDLLFVSKEHRGGSLGIKLMKATEKHAKLLGCKLMLWHAKQDTTLAQMLPRLRYGVQDIVFSKEL